MTGALGVAGATSLPITAKAHSGMSDRFSPAAAAAIAAVIQTESRFSSEAGAMGIVPAFRRHVGPDAVMFLPRPTIINPLLETANWPGSILWRPLFAAPSDDGSVVVTAGPSAWTVGQQTDHGIYFTVWRLQADGTWRFVVDGNVPMDRDLYGRTMGDAPSLISPTAPPSRPDSPIDDFGMALHPSAWRVRNQASPLGGNAPPLDTGAGEVLSESGRGASADRTLAWSWGLVKVPGSSEPNATYFRALQTGDGATRVVFDSRTALT